MSLNILTDLYIRLAILEGGAGVSPRTFTGRGDAPSLYRGLQVAKDQLTGWPVGWFSLKGTPFLDALEHGAEQAGDDVEDIVQAVVGGFTRSAGCTGGELYNIGQRGPWKVSEAAAHLCRHAYHRSLDVVRRARPSDVSLVQVKDVSSRIDDLAGHPAMKVWLLAVCTEVWAKNPSMLAIARLWIDDPSRTGVSIALELGHPVKLNTSSYVSHVIREIRSIAVEAAESGKLPGFAVRYVEATGW